MPVASNALYVLVPVFIAFQRDLGLWTKMHPPHRSVVTMAKAIAS